MALAQIYLQCAVLVDARGHVKRMRWVDRLADTVRVLQGRHRVGPTHFLEAPVAVALSAANRATCLRVDGSLHRVVIGLKQIDLRARRTAIARRDILRHVCVHASQHTERGRILPD